MTYSDKLKDPRWQKKRLKVMERDGFACKYCGDTGSTLMVHHLKYNGKPWDVADDYLITLCEEHHKAVEFLIQRVRANSDDRASMVAVDSCLDLCNAFETPEEKYQIRDVLWILARHPRLLSVVTYFLEGIEDVMCNKPEESTQVQV